MTGYMIKTPEHPLRELVFLALEAFTMIMEDVCDLLRHSLVLTALIKMGTD